MKPPRGPDALLAAVALLEAKNRLMTAFIIESGVTSQSAMEAFNVLLDEYADSVAAFCSARIMDYVK